MNNVESTMAINEIHLSRWAKVFLAMMSKIEFGAITLITPEGDYLNYLGLKEGEHVTIRIHSWKFCEEVFLKGDIGLGESYIAGLWESDNINALIKFGIQNRKQLEKVIKGSFFKILYYRLKHNFNKNSKQGSKKNIHAHYDLGNEFYKLWLDSSMTYSSALFNRTNSDLMLAQKSKYENIIDQLNLKPGDHILEIGCGWGGFMECAAQRGIKITGITISEEQFKFATKRLEQFGDLATLKLMDYRDIKGQFDHIVSIEMFEAIGEEYWPTFFNILKSSLRPNGKVIIQSITINDHDFLNYRKGTDFIQQYIFPGGMLPSPELFKKIANKQGLKSFGQIEFGKDYGTTLKLWEENFSLAIEKVKELGFDEKFIRTWRFYLKYCQGGFEAGKINVFQFYLTHI